MSVTLVTGLWDIGRGNLSENWSRGYDHYLECFDKLLKTPFNLIVYGDDALEKYVFERRSPDNTQFIHRDLDKFKEYDFYNKIQNIRNNPDWYNQVSWLTNAPNAKLEMYNLIVMCKMYLLNDARLLSKFNNTHLFWIDAGISNTLNPDYYQNDYITSIVSKNFDKFTFVCFPYDANTEVHGFNYHELCKLAGDQTKLVCRGGFFGGPVDSIDEINGLYYVLMDSTLSNGYMGTEESLFTIMLYQFKDLFNYYEIDYNGLMYTFFDNLKNNTLVKKSFGTISDLDINNTALYVLTYNSPDQFRVLIKSLSIYDKDFLNSPKKFLLNNSTDESTLEAYLELCEMYNFTHIKKQNIGISGGRQFCAEHAHENNFDFSLYFEDDMALYKCDCECYNGFKRYSPNLYSKSLEIVKNNQLDFLKLSYTEFFGDNSTQWAWYNVPPHIREKYWPNNKRSPSGGTDPNAPRTQFNQILAHKGLPYALGEIYYSNWPQVVSKQGNKKMFIDTKWTYPNEATWMSHFYQLIKEDKLSSGILLLSPINHNRFDFYPAEERKEN